MSRSSHRFGVRGTTRRAFMLRAACFEALENRMMLSAIPPIVPPRDFGLISNAEGSDGAKDSAANPYASSSVRYSDGVVRFATSDVMSGGFGVDLGVTRNWTNETDYNPNGSMGANWILSELPTLVNDGANTYAVISSGTDARVYTKGGGGDFTPTASLYIQDRLEHSPTSGTDPDKYYLADSSGATFTFYDFTVTPTALRGKLKQFSDDHGNVTTYTYSGTNQFLSEIRRGPTTATESFLFTYDSNDRVSRVTWRKTSDSTANPIVWTTIREVGYAYYGASDSNGNTGDLKLATVHDPSADKAISTSLSWNRSEVSATFSSSPGYVIGDVITVSGATPSGYNGTFVVSDVSGNTIKYALSTNPGTATVNGKANLAMDVNYYRYYINTTEEVDGDTLQGDGYQGGLELAFDARGYARIDAAFSGASQFTATDDDLKAYASRMFAYYPSTSQVKAAWIQGKGSNTGGGDGRGKFTYTYTANSNTPTAGDYNYWKTKTVETLPDSHQNIVYTNQYGQVMLQVFKDTVTTATWPTFYRYDSNGKTTLIAHPSAVSSYSESDNDLLHNTSGNAFNGLSNSAGRIETITYGENLTADFDEEDGIVAGDVPGWEKSRFVQQGDTGTAIEVSRLTYGSRSAGGHHDNPAATGSGEILDYLLAQKFTFIDSGGESTLYSFTFDANQYVTRMSVSRPAAKSTSPNQNGSGNRDTDSIAYDTYGRTLWTRDAEEHLYYTEYDTLTGGLLKQIDDVDTDASGAPTVPTGSGWSNTSGLNLVTTMLVDALGRTTKVHDPNENDTYMVYLDPAHERRVYPGFAAGATTGPIQIYREYRPTGTGQTLYGEALTVAVSPSLNGSSLPNGQETFSASNIRELTRALTNNAGQQTELDEYFSVSGLTYSRSSVYMSGTASDDTSSGNYHATTRDYDTRGRATTVTNPSDTVYKTVFDGQNRAIEAWVGPSSTNLTKTTDYEYDGGGVGDSTLTTMTEHPGVGQDDRVTKMYYDWRDRRVAVKEGVRVAGESGTTGVQRQITYLEYDNMDHVTLIEKYDGDEGTISLSSGVPQRPTYPSGTTASRLRAKTATAYDDQGRRYSEAVYGVNPSTGSTSTNTLLTSVWYDPRGNVIKMVQPGRPTEKYSYDGAGRVSKQFSGDASGDGNYAAAQNVSGDTVLQQNEWTYDKNGNVTFAVTKQLAPTSSSTGEIGNAPSDGGGGAAGGSAASPAWISYVASYFDAANRITASVDPGNHAGYNFPRPSTAPSGDPTTGTADSGGSTTTLVDSPLTGSDDAYVGYTLTITNGTHAGTVATVIDYVASSHTLTFSPALPSGTPDGATYTLSDGRTTTYSYDDAGRLEKRFDPRKDVGSGNHIVSKYFYDMLGRTTKTIENWTSDASSSRSDSANRTTIYDYTGEDRIKRLKAALPDSGGSQVFQTTEYVYGESELTISTISLGSGSATITTSSAHGYHVGEYVTIRGTTSGTYDGTFKITDTTSTAFKFAMAGSGSASGGSVRRALFRNDLLSAVRYPDKGSGAASFSEQESFTYDQIGERLSYADRNLTVHDYSYDVLGRLLSDAALLASGSAVNTAILRLEYNYDSAGRPFQFTSYSAVSSGTVVNQVQREYNAFGQLAIEYQEDAGAIDTETIVTPEVSATVEYAYSHDADQNVNHSRLTSTTYPDGRQLDYTYSTGVDDNISRLGAQGWSGDATVLEQYKYLGVDQVVGRVRPESDTQMLLYHYSGTGDPPDYWFGRDRFGRTANLTWETTSGGTDLDAFQYGYDVDNNGLLKNNLVKSDKSELYHADGSTAGYDDYDRLSEFQRGTLSDANTDGVLDTASGQSRRLEWGLDTLGNWSTITTDGSSASRSHNKQNQITAIGSGTYGYSNNGNMTSIVVGTVTTSYTYDAWNRLLSSHVSNAINTYGYAYDALGRRIQEATSGGTSTPTNHVYYSASWQVILEQTTIEGGIQNGPQGGDSFATSGVTNRYAYVWSPDYIDSMVTREKDATGNGSYEERLYVEQDANHNVTSVLSYNGSAWGVKERYIYDPYGVVTVLNGAQGFDANTNGTTVLEWSNDSGSSDIAWVYMHQGGRYDGGTGLYVFRMRDYSPALGRWMEQDPIQYAGGQNLYGYLDSNPTRYLDPVGTNPILFWIMSNGPMLVENGVDMVIEAVGGGPPGPPTSPGGVIGGVINEVTSGPPEPKGPPPQWVTDSTTAWDPDLGYGSPGDTSSNTTTETGYPLGNNGSLGDWTGPQQVTVYYEVVDLVYHPTRYNRRKPGDKGMRYVWVETAREYGPFVGPFTNSRTSETAPTYDDLPLVKWKREKMIATERPTRRPNP